MSDIDEKPAEVEPAEVEKEQIDQKPAEVEEEQTPPSLTGPVKWSAKEGKMVADDNPIPEGHATTMVRRARVANGVVMQATVEYPDNIDPNVYYQDVLQKPEIASKFFLCPDPQVASWWLYDEASDTYSQPPPITDPPLAGIPPGATVESVLTELKSNPELL